MYLVTVNKDKCEGCGACISICPMDVFEMVDDEIEVVDVSSCKECESCVEVCPLEAIEIGKL